MFLRNISAGIFCSIWTPRKKVFSMLVVQAVCVWKRSLIRDQSRLMLIAERKLLYAALRGAIQERILPTAAAMPFSF